MQKIRRRRTPWLPFRQVRRQEIVRGDGLATLRRRRASATDPAIGAFRSPSYPDDRQTSAGSTTTGPFLTYTFTTTIDPDHRFIGSTPGEQLMTAGNLTTESASQRGNSRIVSDPCPVQFHDKQRGVVSGVVLDESFGGLGLMFSERVRLSVDENIQVSHNGVRTWAFVRHITVSNVQTCRVGLEWKAASLSRRARAAMSRGALQPTSDSREAKRRARFLSLIPGGVNMLWKLFEAGNWPALANSLQRLRRESGSCALDELCVLAAEVETLIEGKANSQHIRPALDALVEYCLHLVEMAAIESIG